MKKQTLLNLTALGAVLLCGSAMAQNMTVRLGVANVDPNSNASAIRGPFTPANALSLEVQPQTTLYASLSRAIDDNWNVELALGAPPTHDVTVVVLKPDAVTPSVVAANGQVGAKIRQIAPTLFLNYAFGAKSNAFRPFVGIGVNYSAFDKRESTAINDAVNGGPTHIKLKSSLGLAAQVGVIYQFNPVWSVSASLATAAVKTQETTNTLGIIRMADIDFKPAVFALAVGYTF